MDLICLQLDLARQKESIEYVQQYFDNAKKWGYNTIFLYLENAVRTPSTPYFNEEDTYSMEEMRGILDYAKRLDLRVIPAFENLAHLEKFFAYPQLRDLAECDDDKAQGRGFSPYTYANCGCVSNERLYEVMDRYITEVSSLFDSEYIHMGLDEPFDFAVCEKCRQRIRQGESKADMFYKHVMRSYGLVKKLGKRMMMWDDFFEYADIVERLPRDIILCNWNYSFVSVEPAGHWTNRIKKDWFYLYEKLGFEYMFCVYAHRSSSTYNLESFTKYAQKYNPLGGVCTTWCRNDSFYLGAYPFMAYAAQLWGGQVCDERSVLDIYTQEIGDEETARLVLSLQLPSFCLHFSNVDVMCENEYLVKYAQLATFAYAIEKLRQRLNNDVVLDIYNYTYEYWLQLQLTSVGNDIFDQIERGEGEYTAILQTLGRIKKGFAEIEGNLRALWEKYRKGIASARNSLEKKYAGKQALMGRIENWLLQGEKSGVLYLDTMLHDGYCTAKAELKVHYRGDRDEKVLFDGQIKSSLSGYEVGGTYGFRFRIENRPIDYVLLSVYGEGALYPLHLRYLIDGERYVADTVERVCGCVKNEGNILSNDTQFAEMGNNDGIAHFNDIALSKEKHTVKLTFKPFA